MPFFLTASAHRLTNPAPPPPLTASAHRLSNPGSSSPPFVTNPPLLGGQRPSVIKSRSPSPPLINKYQKCNLSENSSESDNLFLSLSHIAKLRFLICKRPLQPGCSPQRVSFGSGTGSRIGRRVSRHFVRGIWNLHTNHGSSLGDITCSVLRPAHNSDQSRVCTNRYTRISQIVMSFLGDPQRGAPGWCDN